MNNLIDEIMDEILELMPEYRGREQELKDIVDKLLQSQPDVEMNERFKAELREKILQQTQKEKKVIPLGKKLLFIVPGGMAAALALMLTLNVFIQKEFSKEASHYEPEAITMADTLEGYESAEQPAFDPTGAAGQEGQTPPAYQDQHASPVELTNSSTLSAGGETTEVIVSKDDVSPPIQPELAEPIPLELAMADAETPMRERELLRSERAVELDFGGYLSDADMVEMDELMGMEEILMEAPMMAASEEIASVLPEPEEQTYPGQDEFNTEEFSRIYENDFLTAFNDPVSTFSIDVDTASYSNTRRYLMNGSRPPADAVRIEELINYFDYGYPEVEGEHPFDFNTALTSCPWNEDNQLLFVGVQGERMAFEQLPPNNLVFLLDVSGSMSDANKLPLLKQSLEMLTRQLRPQDRVSIVVYAGAAGVVLQPTAGNRTDRIISAFDRLEAGGSTAGGEGIELAYALAERTFMEQGNNRIIIATDGDFNVGPSSTSETTRLIEEKRDKGIFLTVLGFGMGNYKDSRMEQMADNGNGNYAYIDNLMEAKKVLVNEISSTLYTIASDVKIQIEFNPYAVEQYRLIGYENRVMANQDFHDDTKDAGELGAGHSVTAIYEIVPRRYDGQSSEELRYQDQVFTEEAQFSGEVMTIKFRYKNPGEDESTLIEQGVANLQQEFQQTDRAFRFAAAVAQWGMLLRGSEYSGDSSYQWVLDTARDALGYDPYGLKAEFLNLVELSELME